MMYQSWQIVAQNFIAGGFAVGCLWAAWKLARRFYEWVGSVTISDEHILLCLTQWMEECDKLKIENTCLKHQIVQMKFERQLHQQPIEKTAAAVGKDLWQASADFLAGVEKVELKAEPAKDKPPERIGGAAQAGFRYLDEERTNL